MHDAIGIIYHSMVSSPPSLCFFQNPPSMSSTSIAFSQVVCVPPTRPTHSDHSAGDGQPNLNLNNQYLCQLQHNRPTNKQPIYQKTTDSQEPFDSRSPNNLVSPPTATFLISHLKQHQNGRRPEISNEKPVLDENKKYYVR